MNADEIQKLETRVAAIEQRNQQVTADKAWEVSLTRKALLTVLTYLTAVVVMLVIRITDPWLSALIPTLGYILSAQSLPLVKRWWLRRLL